MLTLLDVTLRDGILVAPYLNDKVRAYSIINCLLESGIECIEIGDWDDKVKESGPSSCDMSYLENLPPSSATYCMMIHPQNMGNVNFEQLASTPVNLIRFPCLPTTVQNLEPYIYKAKEAGFKVSLNITRASDHTLTQMMTTGKLAESWNVDWLYLADSNGSMMPDEVYEVIDYFRKNFSVPIGFHAHNGLSFALANALQAIKAGASFIDTSICGLGRGQNLSLELIGMFLGIKGELDLKIMPIFEAIWQEIYLLEGGYTLTMLENASTAVLNYNLDKISELKSQNSSTSSAYLKKLVQDFDEAPRVRA